MFENCCSFQAHIDPFYLLHEISSNDHEEDSIHLGPKTVFQSLATDKKRSVMKTTTGEIQGIYMTSKENFDAQSKR